MEHQITHQLNSQLYIQQQWLQEAADDQLIPDQYQAQYFNPPGDAWQPLQVASQNAASQNVASHQEHQAGATQGEPVDEEEIDVVGTEEDEVIDVISVDHTEDRQLVEVSNGNQDAENDGEEDVAEAENPAEVVSEAER